MSAGAAKEGRSHCRCLPAQPGRDLVPARHRPPIIAEFQPDAVELEERVPPRIARLTLYGVTGFIAAAIVWASLSSIDEVVVAPGKLITTKPTIIVQPLETSIIRSIDVATGDVVRAGQTLATLDATFSQSDVEQQRAKFAALDAQVKRHRSRTRGADYSTIAGNSSDEQLQVQLFGQRHAFYVAQIQNYRPADRRPGRRDRHRSKDQEMILVSRRDNLAQIEEAREILCMSTRRARCSTCSARAMRVSTSTQTWRNCVARPSKPNTRWRSSQADRQAFIEDFRRATMEQLVELRSQRDTAAKS